MTKNIICTLGPASQKKETIMEMADSGMKIVRLNFSHGDHQQHQKMVDTIRAINEERGYRIKILQDLEGYRIRIGRLEHPVKVEKNQHVRLSNAQNKANDTIPLDANINMKSLSKGIRVFINDGMIALKVIACRDDRVELVVENGGVISSKKGVNIPGIKLGQNILTDKDKKDIAFGLANKVDYMAQSFVRNRQDLERVVNIVKPSLPNCRFIAKIENREGLENIAEIMEACEGVMVARGDLGVSLPIYQIPFIQKDIIRRCNKAGKFVITATQMLESMTEHFRPTRAEVCDVANAILDGTDFVMLSGETAVGRFPVESVKMMRQVTDLARKRTHEWDAHRP